MRYYQYHLTDDGNAQLVTWLGTKKRLKEGTKLTLKETGDIVWMITTSYDISLDLAPNQRWKVGGLT